MVQRLCGAALGTRLAIIRSPRGNPVSYYYYKSSHSKNESELARFTLCGVVYPDAFHALNAHIIYIYNILYKYQTTIFGVV